MGWSPEDVAALIVNPFYAITVAEVLCQDHQPLIGKDEWIKANEKLIEELGARKWLATLLEVLESGGPTSPG